MKRSPNDFQGPAAEEFNSRFACCWNCQNEPCRPRRSPSGYRWSSDWPTTLENAHVVGGHGRRVNDRRVICRLCNLCHQLAHRATIRVEVRRRDDYGTFRCRDATLPWLELENLLWLKLHYDPEYYDPAFIAQCAGWSGPESLPDPAEPPEWP